MFILKLFLTILISVGIFMSYSVCSSIKEYIFTSILTLILVGLLVINWII